MGSTGFPKSLRVLLAPKNRFAWLLSLLVPPYSREAFLAWYAYLRWADDQVDENPHTTAYPREFLSRQRDVIRGIVKPETDHEDLLRILLAHPVLGQKMTLLIEDMLECVVVDAETRGSASSYAALRSHWRKEVRAYLGAIATFCRVKGDGDPVALVAAEGAKFVHILRDLRRDLEMRQINISSEELSAFGLTIEEMGLGYSQAYVRWVTATARLASEMLDQGLHEVRGCRAVRYKVIVAVLASKYQCLASALLRNADGPHEDAIGLRPFVAQLARNLAVAFGMFHQAGSRCTFLPVVKPSLRSRLAMASMVTSWPERAEAKALRRSLRNIAIVPDPRRMRRRFRIACLMGRTGLATVAPEAGAERDLRKAAGLLYGYWSICAIELDRLMDERHLTPEQAHSAAESWLMDLHSTLFERIARASPFTALGVDTSVFNALTAAFMNALRQYDEVTLRSRFSGCNERARQQFFDATAELMAGQLRSLQQTGLATEQNWSWYKRGILNAKNVQFLLAPFNLWLVQPDAETNLSRFTQQFRQLNEAYLHYQLIDDVADIVEDTSEGIIGAPGAILLSQGMVAESALAYGEKGPTQSQGSAAQILAATIAESGLLDETLADAPLFDGFRHCFAASLRFDPQDGCPGKYLLCALANRKRDLALPVRTLAQLRVTESNEFLSALSRRDFNSAETWLLRSGAPDRLVNAVGSPAAAFALRRLLDHNRSSSSTELLFLLEKLMQHTHRAALKVIDKRE